MPNVDDIRQSTQLLDLRAASRDLWPGGTLDHYQGRDLELPARVFWPDTEAEVEAVLKTASERGKPIVPYGAGSGVCGGTRGGTEAWVVDVKSLQRIGPLDESRWTVVAQAGVNGQQLEDWLNARGFTLGHSPSSIWCSTVGGWAAARSAGQFSSKYGVFEDMVLGLRVVSPEKGIQALGIDGDDDADAMAMWLGSEGTLGVVTEVTMRIWPLPKERWLRGYRFRTVAEALDAMRALMQGELWPSVVRLYDPVDTRIGGKTKPKSDHGGASFVASWLKQVSNLPAVKRRTLALPLSLPGFVNQVFDRIAGGCLLIVGWEGEPELVAALSNAGHALLCEKGEDLGPDPGWRWFHSRHAVSYKLMPIFERGGFADTMEIAVRWSDMENVYEAVRDAVQPYAVIMAHMSHVYAEGGSIYFSFAGKGDRAVYDAVWKAAQQAVLDSGATVTHHHGVGRLKAPWASREVGAAKAGWRALKAELDPQGVCNPGAVYGDEDGDGANQPTPFADFDGLVRAAPGSSWDERQAACGDGELLYPWERLPAPPRWQRLPWQVGWVEVSGTVDGRMVRLGRGPRSAAGPDLRGWLVREGEDVQVAVPVAPPGARWMGEARCEHPWRVAYDLLRQDLRPAVLTVVDGVLRVGFRGPAADSLGEIAARWVPGGLARVDWVTPRLPVGPLAYCDFDDEGVVAVLPQGPLKEVSP